MKFLFWFSLATISYAYFGYAVLLAVYARFRRKPSLRAARTPTVSIIMAAHNEEKRLPAKLANLSAMRYPQNRLEIVVASDGSTDRTGNILADYAARHATGTLTPVILPLPVGKACALNEAVKHATGEILVFLDVRQSVELNAISELTASFADPDVGAVSGELLLEPVVGSSSGSALGIYWKIEKAIRKLESQTGSVVGVTGAIYAIRRECYVNIPAGTILDDVFVPMNVARQGKRVLFQPTAVAHDLIFTEQGKEFSRKVRTLTGNYQLLHRAPWLLTLHNPLLFRLISHKLLRLIVPFLLLVALVTSLLAKGPFYKVAFVLQLAFYGLALCGTIYPMATRFRPVAIANTFMMLNLAASQAFYNICSGREDVWL